MRGVWSASSPASRQRYERCTTRAWMAAKKPCIRCTRSIDQWAKICPFCNTDQASPKTVESFESAYTTAAPKPTRTRGDFFRSVPGRIVMGLGVILLLGGTFAIGTIVYSLGKAPPPGSGEADNPENQIAGAPLPPGSDAVPGGLTLVPGEVAQTSFGQQQVTTPQQDHTSTAGGLRTDATALSAEVYARMAQAERQRQALEQQQRERAMQTRDPREIEPTPAWAAGQQQAPPRPAATPQPPTTTQPAPPQPADAARAEAEREQRAEAARERQREREEQEPEERTAARRTAPVPTSQPLPDVSDVDGSGTVRLNLTVDASGRVREVEIVQGVPGITARLIESVRRWRFRPATENGQPVQGMFPVEVSFNAN